AKALPDGQPTRARTCPVSPGWGRGRRALPGRGKSRRVIVRGSPPESTRAGLATRPTVSYAPPGGREATIGVAVVRRPRQRERLQAEISASFHLPDALESPGRRTAGYR